MEKISDKIILRLIRSVFRIMALIPFRWLDRFASPVGRLWYLLDSRHRRVAADNVAGALGHELSPRQQRLLVKHNFIQLSRVALELPALRNVRKDNLSEYIHFSGVEHVSAALAQGRGILFMSAHLGNWELMTLSATLLLDVSVYGIVRPLDFKPLDRVIREIRRNTGNVIIDKENSAATIRRLLHDNQVVGILLDQNASWYEGVFVPFFNRLVCTNRGLALFALRYNTPVLPVFNFREPDGRYHMVFEPPLKLVRTGDFKHDIIANTIRFNQIIEKAIRQAPDNWLWVHRRWRLKSVPASARHKVMAVPGAEIPFDECTLKI